MPLRPKRDLVHRCVRCGRTYRHGYTPKCAACDGLIDVSYDLDSATLYDSDVSVERFFDLLPLLDPASLRPVGDGNTPCVHARALGAALGVERLYLKLESRNPTGTTKDRIASVVLSLFAEIGMSDFVSCSTGNSSNALAHGLLRHPQFTMSLYVAGEFRDRLRHVDGNPQVELHVLPDMTFTQAFDHARQQARARRVAFEGGFFNPARREGLKLAYLEAVEQVPHEIDWYVQAVSSAMGVYGVWKGAGELRAMGRTRSVPRLLCVQQETCAPMVQAWREGSDTIAPHHVVEHPQGIAAALLRGNPSGSYPYVRQIVRDSGGTMASTTEEEIRAAKDLLQTSENLCCGYEGAATIAAVGKLAAAGTIGASDVVLLNLTS